ncbi:conserved phage C-terminal domain-containing protein [Symbiopectobacterium purcellii]|uniref:conserved phage C-terminal domain-containing protein n=1 Tax=Symbiopectobacterium purcellii TaxID=2871826 RepID=UPI003F863DEE
MSRIFDVVQAMSGQKNMIVIPRPYLEFFKREQQAHALAAVLNQLVFWSGCSTRDDGWFYKSHKELGDEVGGLSDDQIGRVVDKIIKKLLPGVIETTNRKVNGTPVKHYRIQEDALIAAIFPPTLDSAESRNGNREVAEPDPQNRGIETAESRNESREVAESYLYPDQYTDQDLQIKKDSCQAEPPDDPDQRVLDHFNKVTNSGYRDGKTTMGYIRGRLAEPDYVAEDLIQVVDYLTAKWLNDRKMCDYLRPKTVFAPENFPEYYDKARKWHVSGRPECVDGKWIRPGDMSAVPVDVSERDAAYRRFIGSALPAKNPSQIEIQVRTEASKAGLKSAKPEFAMSRWNSIWKDVTQRQQGGKAA